MSLWSRNMSQVRRSSSGDWCTPWCRTLTPLPTVASLRLPAAAATCVPQSVLDLLDTIDLVFLCLFALELVLKIVGLSAARFWAHGWNRFDFLLVVVSGFAEVRMVHHAPLVVW